MEADSSKFDSAFNLVVSYEENEYLAVGRYKEENPEVALRPFEFEGRDSYRQEHGLSTSPGPAFDLLQDIAAQGLYTAEEQKIWNNFVAYFTQIRGLAQQNLKAVNTTEADALNDSLWRYQYVEVKKIIDARPEFEALLVDTRGDSVTIRQHFSDWAQFDYYDRNNAMVANIRAVMKSMPEAERFVLLTGFQHRHYLRKELVKQGLESQLIEFYHIKPQSTKPTKS